MTAAHRDGAPLFASSDLFESMVDPSHAAHSVWTNGRRGYSESQHLGEVLEHLDFLETASSARDEHSPTNVNAESAPLALSCCDCAVPWPCEAWAGVFQAPLLFMVAGSTAAIRSAQRHLGRP